MDGKQIVKVYKIRDPKTGLFKCAGEYTRWSKQGKVWNGSGPLRLHLKMSGSYQRNGHNPDWEICEYDTEPTKVIRLGDFIDIGTPKKP